ncbi:MAG: patatin family protein [Lachnospiraceae bacterium]|nr:patatin family protein [Lachnospiraceae bacterium]
MYQAGLVLEGGGMKGLYTAGVLDYFLDKNLDFSSVYGVSAGACNMCSYLSKQRGRARDVNTDYLGDKNYCSFWSLLTTGDLFNVDFCYKLIPDYLYPFDHEAYQKYQGKAYSVVTNIVTGQAEYLRVKDSKRDMDMIQASASLPLMARNVRINDGLYLDGGIADAIPIARSIRDGNRKNVVVLTKEEGYVRKPTDRFTLALIKARYLKYPKVYELMAQRRENYNETMDYLYRQVENGQAYVIRPKHASKVGRIEKNRERLLELYQQGYDEAASHYEGLMEYLGKEV